MQDPANDTPMRRKLRIVSDPAFRPVDSSSSSKASEKPAKGALKKAVTLASFPEHSEGEDGAPGKTKPAKSRSAMSHAPPTSARSVKIVNMGESL